MKIGLSKSTFVKIYHLKKVRPATRGLEKERKKERKKERRSSPQKRNEAGTAASILAKERGRNAFLKNEERSML